MDTNKSSFLLQAENLVKHYQGVRAVGQVSLSVREGECFALLGPNGAGKTTTCEMLEGLVTPDDGHIRLFGMQYADSKKNIQEHIGIQLQETQLYKKYTVSETLLLFASFYKSSMNLDEVLSLLKLQEIRNKRLERLSGGQRQAVYLACALIHRPKLLFLDEPTAGLDPRARRMLWDVISGVKDGKRGIFLTTHYLEEAEQLADRIAIMDKGKIIAEGSPSELVSKFCPGEVLRFSIEGDEHEVTHKGEQLKLSLPWLNHAVRTDQGWELQSPHASRHIQELTVTASQKGIALISFFIRQATLEDVFLKITGRTFRNEIL
jgi:ABC-2 type transport system ATP-binding protein